MRTWFGRPLVTVVSMVVGLASGASMQVPNNEVRLTSGAATGVSGMQPGVRMFLGLPYAAPPVGPLRWAPPQPPASWTGVRRADRFGNRCIQTNPFPDMAFRSAMESEDCLTLSVWTPAQSSAERLPVMVWIHGGGFFSGASDEGRHEGSVLASKGVVVVAINYRLGVLGFLAHPELTAESAHRSSGNYGLLDQVAALQWVKTNIGAFGGDANQVTIFGESAGSFAVSALMASPLSAGLFARAIGQSGAYLGNSSLALVPLAKAEALGLELGTTLGATSLAALRARPAAALVKAVGVDSTRFVPILDGHLLPADPWDVFASGRQHRVPLVAGWTSAEIKVASATTAGHSDNLRRQFPNDIQAAERAYAASSDTEARLAATALASDNFIGYNTWKWIETHAATAGVPVFRYLFDHVVPTATGEPAADDPGAGHASDIDFAFHTLDARKLAWRAVDRRVADLMVTYWTNFAKTGAPSGPGVPTWPPVGTTGARQVMRIHATSQVEPERNRARYELLDTVETRKRSAR
jgi:para-nitrobenzyl esterase